MEIASPQRAAYAAMSALRPPAPTAAISVAATGGLASTAAAVPGSAAASSTRVQLSPLGQVSGAIGNLLSSTTLASAGAVAQSATRIAQAIAVLNQSISSLAVSGDGSADELDFLSGAGFSQRLLASGLTDSVNGRATGGSLESLGLRPLPGGAFEVDRAALEQSFRTDPAGVLALVTDYARNLDGFFAQRAGALLDRATLTGAGAAGGGPTASLGDFATRQALAAFRANALL
jgi:hypothetical protein